MPPLAVTSTPGNRYKARKSGCWLLLQFTQRLFERIDPLSRVAIRHRDTIYSSAHEAEQPVLGCDVPHGGVVASFAIVLGGWRVGMKVELPPPGSRISPLSALIEMS